MFSRISSYRNSALLLSLFLYLSGFAGVSQAMQESSSTNKTTSTADHSKFKELQQDFKRGPEVTKACLTCHAVLAVISDMAGKMILSIFPQKIKSTAWYVMIQLIPIKNSLPMPVIQIIRKRLSPREARKYGKWLI